MKNFNLRTIPFIFIALCIAFVSCNKANDTNTGNADFSEYLPGHWSNSDTDEYTTTESLSFDASSENSIAYQYARYPGDDEYEINARGTYTLDGSTITANYSSVSVYTYINGREGNSYKGFTDDVNAVMRYTILSCDGENMTIIDNEGNTLNFHLYRSL